MIEQGGVTKAAVPDVPDDLAANMKTIFKLRVDINDLLPSEDIVKMNAINDGG
jgi:hypothetical protein